FLLPFQVEAWERDSDGVVRPKGLRNETIRANDRLVFAAHVSNDSRIDIYTGGKMREGFKPGLSYSDNIFEAKGFRVQLGEWGFTAPGIFVNLSGRIAYTYQQQKTYYSDPGKWRLVAVGPACTCRFQHQRPLRVHFGGLPGFLGTRVVLGER
ncbi:MAG: hypothetical protein ACP5IE_08075, partial [Infirmifilum sp.]